MEEEGFDKNIFHSEVSDKVSEINETFSEILNLFKETCNLVETQEDITFAGGGINSIVDLFSDYQSRLTGLAHEYRQRFGDLQVHEDKLLRFEKMVLESLEDIPITDAFDER